MDHESSHRSCQSKGIEDPGAGLFAGTGKTTTLVGFAKANPTLRILYLCYNSSVEKAAKGKFPRNVVCKDLPNSLAHAVYGNPVRPQEDEEPASDRYRPRTRIPKTGSWYVTCWPR